jgi:FAD/FMN-containing dehydrogenase
LFWALKGGGGGSFGVVTRLTLQTHELPEVFGGVSNTIKAKTDYAFRAMIRRFVDFYAESLLNAHWGESVSFRGDNSMGISLVFQGLTSEEATAIWDPFYSWLARNPAEYSVSEPTELHGMPARQWWDIEARRKRGSTSVIFDDRRGAPPTHAWWSGDQEQVGAFLEAYDSLWLPASLLVGSRRDQLSDGIFAGSRHMPVSLHFNKGLAGAPPEVLAAAKTTAMNPRVIESFALAIIATGSAPRYPGWPGASADDTTGRAKAHAVAAAAAELRKLAPGSGSYVSESNYFNDGWRNEFWGTNYARLSRAKEKYDPEGLFFVHHGVGSESWSADGFIKLGGKQ